MASKTIKECADCGRVMAIVARGLCGACMARHKKAGDLDALYPSKHAKVKTEQAKSAEEKPNHSENQRPEVMATPVKTKTDNSIGEITVRFLPEDAELAQNIKDAAKYHRRSLSQEILFRLEHGVPA